MTLSSFPNSPNPFVIFCWLSKTCVEAAYAPNIATEVIIIEERGKADACKTFPRSTAFIHSQITQTKNAYQHHLLDLITEVSQTTNDAASEPTDAVLNDGVLP